MLSGKKTKTKCGLIKPIEFDCNQQMWTCEKCLDMHRWIIDSINKDIDDCNEKIIMIPEKLKHLKEWKDKTSREISKIQKHISDKWCPSKKKSKEKV